MGNGCVRPQSLLTADGFQTVRCAALCCIGALRLAAKGGIKQDSCPKRHLNWQLVIANC